MGGSVPPHIMMHTLRTVSTLAITACALALQATARSDDLATWVLTETHSGSMQQYLRQHRRALHQIPEMMFQEHKTSAYVQQQLKQLGIPFEAGIAETGIIATIGTGSAPVIALRADMDALPVVEPTQLTAGREGWRSGHEGTMHACGHDVHMTMLLGAAKVLKAHESQLNGTVMLVFQPAEEGGGGAKRILETGKLAGVSAMAGMHVWPTLPSGVVASKVGTLMAASQRFDVVIQGKGAHGAMPHLGNDPIVAASAVVMALQPLVSRETSPLDSAVVTVGVINSGVGAGNIIASQVIMEGTIRALTATTMARVQQRVEEVVVGTARTYGCNATVTWGKVPYLPVVNHPDMVSLLSSVASQFAKTAPSIGTPASSLSDTTGSGVDAGTCSAGSVPGSTGGTCKAAGRRKGTATVSEDNKEEEDVVRPEVEWFQLEEPIMAAEDFSFYAAEMPSVFTFLGIGDPELGSDVALHNPNFQMDESVMALGAALHVATAVSYINQHSQAAGTNTTLTTTD